MAGLGAAFGGLLGNNVLQQIALWQVGGALIGSALGPYMQALSNSVNSITPLVPLSPAELALAVIRGELEEGHAADEAKLSGIGPGRFHTLTRITGQSLGAGDLAVALRRGIIDEATFLRGVHQGNTRDEWADTIKALSVQQPPPGAILQAYLEGQTDEGTARELWRKLGGDPDYFDLLYHTEGQAPTPTQALDLLNRGVIPEGGTGPDSTSYTQAFLEGPWRNKWLGPFLALRRYLPPPRTITAMYNEGSYTYDQAALRLKQNGLNDEDVAAYLKSGAAQATTSTKDLGQAVVTTLYTDRIISRPQAAGFLQAIGYGATEAEYILEIQDLRLVQRYLESAVSRIHTLYVGRKISQEVATSTLAELGVDSGGIPDLIQLWGYEREANVRLLSPTDVASAFKKGFTTEAGALADLAALGYLPHDAWVYLAVHGLAADQKLATPEPPRGSTTATGG